MKCRGCGREEEFDDEVSPADELCFSCWRGAHDFAKARSLFAGLLLNSPPAPLPRATVDAWLEAGAPGHREVGT